MRLQEGDHNWRSNWGLAAIGDDHNWRSARFLGVTQNGSHTAVGAVMTAGVSARRFELSSGSAALLHGRHYTSLSGF